MYTGNSQNRARYDNPYFKKSIESCKTDYLTFISNIRIVLKVIRISYETLCRCIQADGIHVNKDYPARVARGKCVAPSLVYCSFFARKLNLPLYKLLSPTAEFQTWFISELQAGKYSYPGPIVKFRATKNNKLRISIKQGGLISTKGLELNKEVIVTGGRIREILDGGKVLNLGHYPSGPVQFKPQFIYLENFPVSTNSFNPKRTHISLPKRRIF